MMVDLVAGGPRRNGVKLGLLPALLLLLVYLRSSKTLSDKGAHSLLGNATQRAVY